MRWPMSFVSTMLPVRPTLGSRRQRIRMSSAFFHATFPDPISCHTIEEQLHSMRPRSEQSFASRW
jgi:hypothetical protein